MPSPLPDCIDTEEKQRKVAEEIAASHFDKAAQSSRHTAQQGTSSVTLEVELQDDTTVIMQFRAQPFDPSPHRTARRLLKDAVPTLEVLSDGRLQDRNFTCLLMSRIPGMCFFQQTSWTADELLTSATSLGQVLSGSLTPMDKETVAEFVIPSLEEILTMNIRSGVSVTRFFPLIEELITDAPDLETLPGFFSHMDLNPMNIMTEANGRVLGILDWEDARVLPFGMFAWSIHFLAGQFITLESGEIGFVERPEYESMERAFWKTLLAHLPQDTLRKLEGRKDLVQLAIRVGTVLRVLGVQRSQGRKTDDVHLPSVRALPKLLAYRPPIVRGANARPFRSENAAGELDAFML